MKYSVNIQYSYKEQLIQISWPYVYLYKNYSSGLEKENGK